MPRSLLFNTYDVISGQFALDIKLKDDPKPENRFDYELNTYIAQVRTENTLYGSLFGAACGLTGAAALLAKDAVCGVIFRGGPKWHGRDRAKPLAVLVLGMSVFGAYLGYQI